MSFDLTLCLRALNAKLFLVRACNAHLCGDYLASESLAERARIAAEELDDAELKARIYEQLGRAQEAQGVSRCDEALGSFQEAAGLRGTDVEEVMDRVKATTKFVQPTAPGLSKRRLGNAEMKEQNRRWGGTSVMSLKDKLVGVGSDEKWTGEHEEEGYEADSEEEKAGRDDERFKVPVMISGSVVSDCQDEGEDSDRSAVYGREEDEDKDESNSGLHNLRSPSPILGNSRSLLSPQVPSLSHLTSSSRSSIPLTIPRSRSSTLTAEVGDGKPPMECPLKLDIPEALFSPSDTEDREDQSLYDRSEDEEHPEDIATLRRNYDPLTAKLNEEIRAAYENSLPAIPVSKPRSPTPASYSTSTPSTITNPEDETEEKAKRDLIICPPTSSVRSSSPLLTPSRIPLPPSPQPPNTPPLHRAETQIPRRATFSFPRTKTRIWNYGPHSYALSAPTSPCGVSASSPLRPFNRDILQSAGFGGEEADGD
ncbi:hypothetical protein M501DRAFT_1031790 [Patellaria atrata CBS 101060]|uniref:Uncharacterized protein n=1 Tax=Patellaria atrata CBS 101060 TaxID=1346257 RepID=A0A9P4SBR8_9PEZI|nr:hypothetical protein M501DRAFT_1031790 [Patellaria atrata CBS 101060]